MKSNHIKILLSSIFSAILIWTIYFIIQDQKERGYSQNSPKEIAVELYTDRVTKETSVRPISSENFDLLGEGYSIHQGGIYYDKKLVTDVDIYNFKRFPGQPTSREGACGTAYWTNEQEVFYGGKMLDANRSNFTINIGYGFKCYLIGYAWDWNKVFYAGEEIKGIDAASFKVIRSTYARDKYRAYDGGKVMIGNPDEIERGILNGTISHCEAFGDPECREYPAE